MSGVGFNNVGVWPLYGMQPLYGIRPMYGIWPGSLLESMDIEIRR